MANYYKLPINKISRKKPSRQKESGLYYKNRQKLSLIPTVFVVLTTAIVTLAVMWNYNILNFRTSIVAESGLKGSLPENLLDDIQIGSEAVAGVSENKEIIKEDPTISIKDIYGKTCVLELTKKDPDNLKPWFNSQSDGWWIAKDCPNQEIEAIQIIQVPSIAVDKLGISPKIAQQLDKNKNSNYAFIYPSTVVEFELMPYKQVLTESVYPDRNYFSTYTALETKIHNGSNYYLSQGCIKKTEKCELWYVDAKTSQLELGVEDLLEAKKTADGKNPDNVIVTFSMVQNQQDVLILLFDKNTKMFDLLQFDLEQREIRNNGEGSCIDPLFAGYC